ncbi:MAG: hypothetical protein ACTHL1_00770, partial [Burkholderiaceae bacterium]
RALVLSRGDMMVFLQRPISATFIGICALLVLVQIGFYLRGRAKARRTGGVAAARTIISPAATDCATATDDA